MLHLDERISSLHVCSFFGPNLGQSGQGSILILIQKCESHSVVREILECKKYRLRVAGEKMKNILSLIIQC